MYGSYLKYVFSLDLFILQTFFFSSFHFIWHIFWTYIFSILDEDTWKIS